MFKQFVHCVFKKKKKSNKLNNCPINILFNANRFYEKRNQSENSNLAYIRYLFL